MFYQINVNGVKTLQSVLHSAPRLIIRKRKIDSITPTLRDDLYWLSMPAEVSLQTLHHHLQVSASDCSKVPSRAVCARSTASRHHLRSAARGHLQVLATRTVTFGPYSFTASAPKLLYILPSSLLDSTLSLTQFRTRLKTVVSFCLATDAPRDCLGCTVCAL